jgi:hypothetical protein
MDPSGTSEGHLLPKSLKMLTYLMMVMMINIIIIYDNINIITAIMGANEIVSRSLKICGKIPGQHSMDSLQKPPYWEHHTP